MKQYKVVTEMCLWMQLKIRLTLMQEILNKNKWKWLFENL